MQKINLIVGIFLLNFLSAASGQAPKVELPAQVLKINELIKQTWNDYEMKPSGAASDGEWCRRVYLDIIGRIPTVEELDQFTSNRTRNKKAELIATLLYDEKYTEEYARNWTTLWTNILIGRTGGTERDTLTSREGMQKYLRDTLARNKPYDKMVFELVSATGSTVPGSEKFNGATNFLAMKVNEEKASLATAATSKTFLGLQVQCTQCHNHPFNDWKQQKYWEMNAFFRQTRALRRFTPGTRNISGAELIDQDFAGEDNEPQQARVFYELRNGETRMALPKFVDGTEIQASGYVSDVNRRSELAKMIVKSPFMDKTIVNRMWAHFFGYGFTKPIDDLGPHNQPSHPDLMEYLATEIKKNSYNLKELITWIALSDAYSLSSIANSSNGKDDPQLGESPKFTHFYLRQLRAEELYESLLIATEAGEARGDYEKQERAKSDWLQQFVTQFGTDEGDETTSFNGTIPQVLMMFNGSLVKQAINTKNGGFLSKVANSRLKPRAKLESLFKAAFARKPTRKEADTLLDAGVVAAYKGNETEWLTDIWWSMINSNEFIFNH
ncbi:MAG: DUF1549 domain-containing protein [Planctomycetota bacterium]|nr:DUF1549 domain-containing protein [Planctomycetota bacterium]